MKPGYGARFYGFRGPATYRWGCTDILGQDLDESVFQVHDSWRARQFWLQFFDYYQFEHVLLFEGLSHLVAEDLAAWALVAMYVVLHFFNPIVAEDR